MTNVTLRVPSPLRTYCSDRSELALEAASVGEALGRLESSHTKLYRSICDETGAVRRHVNVFVNSAHIRDLQSLDTRLAEGDVITILPAVSGG